jgi:polar amino acid transport system permease protein
MTETKTAERAQPEAITAVPVRHPGRWVAIVVLAIVAAMFVHMLVTNEAFQWRFMLDNMFRPPVIEGVRTTLIVTVLAMIIGVALGIVIAMMRLSPNPILSGAAWLYTWFFRAVPRIVLLILFGNLGILYASYGFGLPFDHQLGDLFGIDLNARLFSLDARTILTGFMAGLLGLALSEAAYGRIVRAGAKAEPTRASRARTPRHGARTTLRRIVRPGCGSSCPPATRPSP